MSKQYIKASNNAPNLTLGTILLWFMAIDYFNWPDWSYGVWGLLSIVIVVNAIYRISTETGVDLVKREDK